jgi:proteasome assembly chaperone (PAC2) family protein
MTNEFKEVQIVDRPISKEIFMFVGWRQWADAGSVSSGLPQYLIELNKAHKIGEIDSNNFYLFQIPGTHDLVRPIVKFNEGFPEFLEDKRNEFFYSGDEERGIVYFIGDEPHLNAEQYVGALLHVAKELRVKRIIGFGGVYGELPYNKERMISSTYSHKRIKTELDNLGVNFSDYQGGGSIGSFMCRRASELDIEYTSLYAFVPVYDFTNVSRNASGIQIENDFMAWLGIMRRVNYMLKLNWELTDLEAKSERLIKLMDDKIQEIAKTFPEINIHEYMQQLNDSFEEVVFEPLQDFWEDEINRLFDRYDDEDQS